MKRMFACILLLIVSQFTFAQQSREAYQDRISIINKNIYSGFYEANSGLFYETNDSNKNEHPHSYLWPLCALIQAANESEAVDSKTVQMKPVINAIEQYHSALPPAPGYQAYVTKEKTDSRFYDDNQWIAIAYLDAYNRTGKQQFLDKSKEIYRFMMTGFDTLSGGGLYWREDEKTSKNTCSNGPGILIALQLYKLLDIQVSRDRAQKITDFINSLKDQEYGGYLGFSPKSEPKLAAAADA